MVYTQKNIFNEKAEVSEVNLNWRVWKPGFLDHLVMHRPQSLICVYFAAGLSRSELGPGGLER